MARRTRPKISREALDDSLAHSHEHRGDLGRFGDFFIEEVKKWRKVSEGTHEFIVIPFLVKAADDSPFRGKTAARFNLRWKDSQIQAGDTWDYRLTVLVHNNVGVNRDSVICPRTIGEKCPLCEERMKLDEDDPGFKALAPTKRTLYNIVILDSDKDVAEGVQVWVAPSQSIEDILSNVALKGRGQGIKPFYDPYENYIVRFERQGSGRTSTKYLGLALEKLADPEFDDAAIEGFLEAAYVLDEIVEVKSYQELSEMISGTLEGAVEISENGGDGGEESQGPARRRRSRTAPVEEEPELADEHATARRSRRTPKEKPPEPEVEPDNENPDCFGLECNNRKECEDCPDETFEGCYKETQAGKAPKGRRSRG